VFFAPAYGEGWIGDWSPGIGDPTWIGWLTVVLYLIATWACWYLASRGNRVLLKRELRLYRILSVALGALALNKQLDLQTGLTELGRILARDEGWYEMRRVVQLAFVVAIAAAALLSVAALAILTRKTPWPTRGVTAGAAALLAFIVIRAASFHHIDRVIRAEMFGVRVSAGLEIGGILTVLLLACGRALYGPARELAAGGPVAVRSRATNRQRTPRAPRPR
jgi:hypothetical protein